MRRLLPEWLRHTFGPKIEGGPLSRGDGEMREALISRPPIVVAYARPMCLGRAFMRTTSEAVIANESRAYFCGVTPRAALRTPVRGFRLRPRTRR